MKKLLVHIVVIVFAIGAINTKIAAQGCVAIRSNGNTCSLAKPEDAKGWQLNLNNRYFKSYKHFVGTEEQKERVERGTDVRNYSYSLDITLTRNLNTRWSLGMALPIISNVRSSMYEHYGNNSTSPNARNNTKSFGIGDMRFTAYRWMFDPLTSHAGNLQIGLGIKLPTGDYQVQDYFHKPTASGGDSTIMGYVDQSIQLGDGGTGIIAEVNGFYNVSHMISLYGNFFYLLNPREQNGVNTGRGNAPSATAYKYFTNVMSVPDQYMARAGVNVMAGQFNVSAGMRLEAIPSSDLIGGDKGFRRPGYVLSAEPVVSYAFKKASVYLSVPIAVERNRTQSYSDKLRSIDDGEKRQGDAAFADYLVNAGVTIRL